MNAPALELWLGIVITVSPALIATAQDLSQPLSVSASHAEDQAYREPLPGLTPSDLERFEEGRKGFAQHWVVAPSVFGLWGRGPTSNGEACTDCHTNGGRGRATDFPDTEPRSMIYVRLKDKYL